MMSHAFLAVYRMSRISMLVYDAPDSAQNYLISDIAFMYRDVW